MANKYHKAATEAWTTIKSAVEQAGKATGAFGAGSIPVSEAKKFIPKKKKKK